MYSEKATTFCEISTVNLSFVVTVKSVKSRVGISKNFVAFSEYMNFKSLQRNLSYVILTSASSFVQLERRGIIVFQNLIGLYFWI